jgi:hypothetical protein
MFKIGVSFHDTTNEEKLKYHVETECENICGFLNCILDAMRHFDFRDDLIMDVLGTTHFDEDRFEALGPALQEAIDEYQVSRDTSDSRLDDITEYPEI